MVSPLIDLHGAEVRWPDGTVGTIRQEYWPHVDRLLGDGHTTYVVPIDVFKPGCLPVSGAVRFSDDYLTGLHGETDVEKSREALEAVRSKLVAVRLDTGFTFTLLCS